MVKARVDCRKQDVRNKGAADDNDEEASNSDCDGEETEESGGPQGDDEDDPELGGCEFLRVPTGTCCKDQYASMRWHLGSSDPGCCEVSLKTTSSPPFPTPASFSPSTPWPPLRAREDASTNPALPTPPTATHPAQSSSPIILEFGLQAQI